MITKPYQSIEEVTGAGDDLEALIALRQKIARTIDESNSGRDIAALSRQLLGVMNQIAELKEAREAGEDPVAEIMARKKGVRDSRGRVLYDLVENGDD